MFCFSFIVHTIVQAFNIWISTKHRTLHYLNITYGHTHYDVCTLPCVLSETSLWCQS